jgi:hypothetical protein
VALAKPVKFSFHLRGGLSFEYGRYRDAVTGMEVGFSAEGYTKRLLTFSPATTRGKSTGPNRQFFPICVLLTCFYQRS